MVGLLVFLKLLLPAPSLCSGDLGVYIQTQVPFRSRYPPTLFLNVVSPLIVFGYGHGGDFFSFILEPLHFSAFAVEDGLGILSDERKPH